MITIEFNGEPKQIGQASTVEDLLKLVQIEGKFCAVELNLEIVPKAHYKSQTISDGDKIEVVTLVGGG